MRLRSLPLESRGTTTGMQEVKRVGNTRSRDFGGRVGEGRRSKPPTFRVGNAICEPLMPRWVTSGASARSTGTRTCPFDKTAPLREPAARLVSQWNMLVHKDAARWKEAAR